MNQTPWVKLTTNEWPNLATVNLAPWNGIQGVYIIWVSGGDILKVGSGDIGARLTSHRTDPAITKYAYPGKNLMVTWARVDRAQEMLGMETYLGRRLSPKVAERFPDVIPFPVQTPWPQVA